MKNTLFGIIITALLSMFLVVSCQDGLELTEADEEELLPRKDTVDNDYFFAAEIGGDSLVYRDLINTNITNGSDYRFLSSQFCTTPSYVPRVDRFYFGDFSDTGETNIIQVEIWGCVPPQVNQDTLIEARNYRYGSIADTLFGAIVTYIDQNKKVWQSVYPDNGRLPGSQKRDEFLITDIVGASDEYYREKIAGEFTCILYDSNRNQMELKGGRYITRLKSRLP